jgi:hypothetical protein
VEPPRRFFRRRSLSSRSIPARLQAGRDPAGATSGVAPKGQERQPQGLAPGRADETPGDVQERWRIRSGSARVSSSSRQSSEAQRRMACAISETSS